MSLFHSREYKREKRVRIVARTQQVTGKIPRDTEVKIFFDPKAELLVIAHKMDRVTLPYKRIMDVRVDTTRNEVKDTKRDVADVAGSFGFGKIAIAGRLAGKIMPKTLVLLVLIDIRYIDQQGEIAEIAFTCRKEYEHEFLDTASDDRENESSLTSSVNEFETVLRNIIARNNGLKTNML